MGKFRCLHVIYLYDIYTSFFPGKTAHNNMIKSGENHLHEFHTQFFVLFHKWREFLVCIRDRTYRHVNRRSVEMKILCR